MLHLQPRYDLKKMNRSGKDTDSIVVSKAVARRLAVIKQGLDRRPSSANKRLISAMIERIGLLQLDAINTVERSHYLVALSRLGLYNRGDLDELHHPDGRLFEQWAHAACLIPLRDYRYLVGTIHGRRKEELGPRKREALGPNPSGTLKAVLRTVAKNGPRMSRDFDDPVLRKRSWWNRKPARVALDWLFYTGHLMVQRRVNFQCVYDLTERVLPNVVGARNLSDAGWNRWVTLRSLSCLGIGTAAHIADYYRQPLSNIRVSIEALERRGQVLRIQVEGWRGPAYMLKSERRLLDQIRAGRKPATRTALLSPFDNLIWHRQRVKELFDFEYSNEMYTPLARKQRRFGYYVMPVLHRGQLIGRIDPKIMRDTRTLLVRSIHLEAHFRATSRFASDLAKALRELAAFSGCESIQIGTVPRELRECLLSELR
jgi:uncharacterized protein YcaQ